MSSVTEAKRELEELRRELTFVKSEMRIATPLLSRTLRLVERACGSADFNVYLGAVQKAIMWTNRLRIALALLQLARMRAGDPFAWAMAGIGVAELAADVMMEIEGA